MKPELEQLKATYSQEADGMDNNPQYLDIFTEDSGGGKYFVIKTERWAFDNVEELIVLINNFKKMMV